jgi:hypothetical protein
MPFEERGESKMRVAGITLVLAFGSVAASPASAADHVVQPGQSIQAAIALSQDGDRILVQPGTYLEAIDNLGKAIEIVGTGGAAVTVIDATGLGTSAVTFFSDALESTRLAGFTVRGGTGTESAPMHSLGGGIRVHGIAGTLIEECVIESNTAILGGGIVSFVPLQFLDPWSELPTLPRLVRCVIRNNSAVRYGGGAYGLLIFEECEFENNVADWGGGTSQVYLVDRCTFTGNHARIDGGGSHGSKYLGTSGGHLTTIKACAYELNTAVGEGGGAYLDNRVGFFFGIVVTHSMFLSNSSATASDLSVTSDATEPFQVIPARIENCLIASGTAASTGHVVSKGSFGPANLNNCTFYGATLVGSYKGRNSVFANNPNPFVSLFPGEFDFCIAPIQLPGTGNLVGDPQLVNPAAGLFQLANGSPAIDAGSPGLPFTFAAQLDIDGKPRYQNGRVDMGAFEFETDCDGSGTPDWLELASGILTDINSDGIPDGCEAIVDCNGNGIHDVVELASGTATDCDGNGVLDVCDPFVDCNGNGLTDSCDLSSGIATDCDRNGVLDSCQPLIDCNRNGVQDICDIASGAFADCNGNGVPDVCELHPTGNSDGDGVLDSCQYLMVPQGYPTIQAAIDAATPPYKTILIDEGIYSGPGNVALDFKGKGLTIRGRHGASRTILDSKSAAAAVAPIGAADGPIRFENLTIRNSNAAGGAVRVLQGAIVELRRCILESNVNSASGGAISAASGAFVVLDHCVLRLNRANVGGGAVFATGNGTQVTLEHCTLAYNTALGTIGLQGPKGGGAIAAAGGALVVVRDSILASNTAPLAPVALASGANSRCEITNSLLDVGQAGVASQSGGVTVLDPANLAGDPSFVDAFGGDVHLAPNSQCLDRGTATGFDYEGDPVMGVADLGADEFHLHLYASGAPAPGSILTLVVVGPAAQGPVLLLASTIRFVPPLATPFGLLEVAPPYFGGGPIVLADALHGGSIQLPIPIHAAPPPGTAIHVQALVAGAPPRLTNALKLAN